MVINQQRSGLVKTRAQVRNVMVFLHAHSQSRSLLISKKFFGSFPSRLARCLRVKASAFSTLCMPGLEQVKRAHKASTCAVAGALLPSKLVRLSARFIWLTIDSALLSPPTSFTVFLVFGHHSSRAPHLRDLFNHFLLSSGEASQFQSLHRSHFINGVASACTEHAHSLPCLTGWN